MLTRLMRDEIATLSELNEFLRQEYVALRTRDLPKLQQLSTDKKVCTERLQTLFDEQTDYLRRQAGSTGVSALRSCIASALPSERTQLEALWADLEENLVQVQRQNGINGAIIAAGRSHVERALTILRGRDPRECLYSQSAQMTFSGSQRPLARA